MKGDQARSIAGTVEVSVKITVNGNVLEFVDIVKLIGGKGIGVTEIVVV